MKESPESLPGSALLDFKQHLGSILSQVERRKDQLDILTNLYEFYDSVSVQTADICPCMPVMFPSEDHRALMNRH